MKLKILFGTLDFSRISSHKKWLLEGILTMIRIVFLAVDDEFSGAMQRYVYETHPEWVVGSVISTCIIYKKSAIGAGWFLVKRCGFTFLVELTLKNLLRKFYADKPMVLPSKLAKTHQVETFYCANINDDESLARLKAWRPNLIISTGFNHYIGKRAREVTVNTWNLHKALLPNYRGMAPIFYALLNNEKTVGATLHVVTKGFDSGDIIAQVKVSVQDNDSFYSLGKRTAEEGGKMLARFLENVDLNNVQTTQQPKGDWPAYSYPDRRDIQRFRRKKFRF